MSCFMFLFSIKVNFEYIFKGPKVWDMGYVILNIQDDEMVLTLTYPDPHFHRCLSVCPHHSGRDNRGLNGNAMAMYVLHIASILYLCVSPPPHSLLTPFGVPPKYPSPFPINGKVVSYHLLARLPPMLARQLAHMIARQLALLEALSLDKDLRKQEVARS